MRPRLRAEPGQPRANTALSGATEDTALRRSGDRWCRLSGLRHEGA